MSVEEHGMSIEELADLVGVPVRTVRYYISEGLLPGPGTRGKGTVYTGEHLLRLRLIRLLAEQRVPLAEIRDRAAGLSLGETRALLEDESRRTRERERAALAESPRGYISELLSQARAARPKGPAEEPMSPMAPAFSRAMPEPPVRGTPLGPEAGPGETWRRLELAPGLELHVRAEAWERYPKLIEQLVRLARTSGNR